MSLKTKDLNFDYPSELVATEPRNRGDSRIFLIPRKDHRFKEINWNHFFDLFKTGDILILNDTKVMKARLLVGTKEIFFLKTLENKNRWQVLTKGLKLKEGKMIELPEGIKARVLKTGKPAEIEILSKIGFAEYFEKNGHVPLPPYILQLRKDHMDHKEDIERYQTAWAEKMGSVAAPTASLHFNNEHLEKFKNLGVEIEYITLHVGAGTFLPIDTDDIKEFKIHSENFYIKPEVKEKIINAKKEGRRVWACGTTVMRALESESDSGFTSLMIKPGFEFKIVDGLLTNFHQPESTLLLLAAAFAGAQLNDKQAIDKIKNAYHEAIAKKFRLFSYGDLTVIV